MVALHTRACFQPANNVTLLIKHAASLHALFEFRGCEELHQDIACLRLSFGHHVPSCMLAIHTIGCDVQMRDTSQSKN